MIDLSGAAAPRRKTTVVPRLRASGDLSARRLGSERFTPRRTSRATTPSRTANSTRTTRVRTRPITRDSVLQRYSAPKQAAKGRAKQPGQVRTNNGRGERLRSAAAQRTKERAASAPGRRGRTASAVKPDRARTARKFDKLAKTDPNRARKIDKAAIRSARLNGVAIGTGVSAALALGGGGFSVGFYNPDFASAGFGPYYGAGYGTGNFYNNGYFWSSYGCWSLGNAFFNWSPWGGYCSPFGYSSFYPSWYGYRSRYCGGLPFFYSSVFTNYFDDDDYEEGFDEGYDRGFNRGVAAADVRDEQVQVGEGVIEVAGGGVAAGATGTRMIPSSSAVKQEALSRAAAHYLTVGDGAFLEGRYGDAVHFYAKAIEFAPDEGVLYLILSDALFATGDYHYAAYALRKALELDPELMASIDDKHSFYKDPTEFDRQVAVLELFLEDHYIDDDARLVLASNYLFGNRPAAAVDLLESPFSKAVRESPAGQALLAAAKSIQYGTPSDD